MRESRVSFRERNKIFKSLPITILYGPSEEPKDVRGSANHIKDEMHMVLVNGYWRGLPEL